MGTEDSNNCMELDLHWERGKYDYPWNNYSNSKGVIFTTHSAQLTNNNPYYNSGLEYVIFLHTGLGNN